MAILRFAIGQRDWRLAELISERMARADIQKTALADRTTAALIEDLDLGHSRELG